MDHIKTQLISHFPSLTQLRLQTASSPTSETFPLFFGLILSAMENASFSPCCFVMPRTGYTASLASIVFALSEFNKQYPELVRKYCENKFVPGQRVSIHPNEHVFEYEGLWPGKLKYFRLRVIGEQSWVTFPVSDILRMEVTERKRPKGKANTKLTGFEEHPLDSLLGVVTYGNQALFRNYVLLLDHQNSFKEFVDNIYIYNNSPIPNMPSVMSLLPFGSAFLDDGTGGVKLEKWDTRNPASEPLVAVTSSIEKIAEACKSVEPHSKVVVANGIGLVLRNLQAYDEICRTQLLVIIAQYDEIDKMRILADRGCRFWRLSEREIVNGHAEASNLSDSGSIFEPIFKAAVNQARLRIEPVGCDDPIWDTMVGLLEDLTTAARNNSAESETLQKLVGRLYGLLLYAASFVQIPNPEEHQYFLERLSEIRSDLARNKMWLDVSASEKIALVCDLFESSFSPSTRLGDEKGRRLSQVLDEIILESSCRVGILARNNHQVERLKAWMKMMGKQADVFSPVRVPNDRFFDHIVIVTWPGSDIFQKFARRYLTSRIKVVGYPFEIKWLQLCQKRIDRFSNIPILNQKDKTALLNLGTDVGIVWPDQSDSQSDSNNLHSHDDLNIWSSEILLRAARKGGKVSSTDDEEVVPAKYVSFVGRSFAYLTENHRIPVVPAQATDVDTGQISIPLLKTDEMAVGDFAVFKDGGSRDVIQSIADLMLGEKAQSLRTLAGMWRRALLQCVMTPELLHSLLLRAGGTYTLVTVRNWVYDEYHIGPGTKTDLSLISKVTGAVELESRQEEIWNAIETIRGAHLSAGMRLKTVLLHKLPDHLDAIKEEGTRINIDGLITAWIVQIERINSEVEQYPKSKVNELQWDDSNYSTW